jgi:hypothetical protein
MEDIEDICCASCGYVVPLHDGYFDFLAEPTALPAFDWRSKQTYGEICKGGGPELPWVPLLTNRGTRELLRTQERFTKKALSQRSVALLVDISAGAGLQLSALSSCTQRLVHWEAHLPSLLWAISHYRSQYIENVWACRGTYLRPALKPHCADAVICFDTIARGEEHDRLVLRNVAALLKPAAIAIVDHHARGASSDSVRSYTRIEFQQLATSAELKVVSTVGAAYGPTVRGKFGPLWHAMRVSAMIANRPARFLHVLQPA